MDPVIQFAQFFYFTANASFSMINVHVMIVFISLVNYFGGEIDTILLLGRITIARVALIVRILPEN